MILAERYTDHWLIKKRLSSKVSSPQIDEWYEEAISWSIGRKIMGAGGEVGLCLC
jgi:galactokinase/mevalonate kinase-like predicted kinase